MAENDTLFDLDTAGSAGYGSTRVGLVDELFHHVAEQVVKDRGGELSVGEVTEWTWQMFELGQIRLVIGQGDTPSLGYEHCGNEEEQREAAKQNKRLVRARRRMQRGQPGQTPYQRLVQRARA